MSDVPIHVAAGTAEGEEARKRRGIEIADRMRITRVGDGWSVPSSSTTGGRSGERYTVRLGVDAKCTCPDHEVHGCKCKHIYAVEYVMRLEADKNNYAKATETVTVGPKRPTYGQNWTAYNAAQTSEKGEFQRLLHDLCKAIEDAPQSMGRPRIPLCDAVFAATFKVYSTVSARRFTCDLEDAKSKGYIGKAPHFNSILNALDNPELTDILLSLIERASLPLKAIETDFAVDSTGFMSSRFVRWIDKKYGTVQQEHTWVKAHLMCGVKTNVVTAVEIRERHANDCPILPALVNATAKNFTVSEVSADKGYSSMANHDAIAAISATPFIAFKDNAVAPKKAGEWEKMFHYFSFRRDEFLAHYHKRSNVESTMMMIKAKFGDAVRSKGDIAMKNEVLAKILCHNICCLISAMHELGIAPTFG
jgi:transposase